MVLYVLRHAIAEDLLSNAVPDSSRRITKKGRRKARRVLSHAASIGVRPRAILTSPYVRARETAEIAASEFGGDTDPVVSSALIPYVSVHVLWSTLRGPAVRGDLMVVGHNPQLSELVMWLLGGRADALWLKKSGLAALAVDPADRRPRATLSWLLTPKSVGPSIGAAGCP